MASSLRVPDGNVVIVRAIEELLDCVLCNNTGWVEEYGPEDDEYETEEGYYCVCPIGREAQRLEARELQRLLPLR